MTDTLTEFGIEADDSEELLTDLRDGDAEEVAETEQSVVFALEHGHALDEWADTLNMEREALADRMHELAREKSDRRFDAEEPFVVRK